MISNPKWFCRDSTDKDVEMYKATNALKFLSKCKDKQVVCIITDNENTILSIGINTIISCDKNCEDHEKRICNVIHAEIMAVLNLNERTRKFAVRAYVNLFPCMECQVALATFVKEIVVFGKQHKKDIVRNLVVFEEAL